MTADTIKIFSPLLLMVFWLVYSHRLGSVRLVIASLYFASYAAFSSNFTFIYRELHQIIQMVIIVGYVLQLLSRPSLHPVNRYLAGFSFLILLSAVVGPLDQDMRAQLINFTVAVLVVNFLISAILIDRALGCLLDYLTCLAILLALIGIAESLLVRSDRIEGTFSNPNYFGLILGIGFCLVATRLDGYLKIGAAGLLLLAIALTGSRSALVFPALQMGWLAYLNRRNIRILFVFAATIVAAIIVPDLGSSRLLDHKRLEYSDAERSIFTRAAFEMSLDHPLTGVGWGRFVGEYANYTTVAERNFGWTSARERLEKRRRVTHNDYLRILAELGWIAFIASIIVSLYGLYVLFSANSFLNPALLPIYTGLIAFSLAHNNMNSALFWFFFLLPFVLERNRIRLCDRVGSLSPNKKSLAYTAVPP